MSGAWGRGGPGAGRHLGREYSTAGRRAEDEEHQVGTCTCLCAVLMLMLLIFMKGNSVLL